MAGEQTTRPRVVLASGSPRRRVFLEDLGIAFEVRPADIDETPHIRELPEVYVERLARTKAIAVGGASNEVVIAADTTVVIDGDIVGKPTDDADAATILRRLSGRSHEVLTGIAISIGGHTTASRVVRTKVVFAELSDAEISWYVATGEPHGKAGAYAIQGRGGALIERVEGSVTNVIGLPLVELRDLLHEVGTSFDVLRSGHARALLPRLTRNDRFGRFQQRESRKQ
jgi:septum formation protein